VAFPTVRNTRGAAPVHRHPAARASAAHETPQRAGDRDRRARRRCV